MSLLDPPAPPAGKVATVTVGSGSRSLTATEYGCPGLVFSGTLAASETYTFPVAVTGRTFRVENKAAGSYALKLIKSGGTAQTVPANEQIEVRV